MANYNNLSSSYFSTGKFAKICNTTKNTLFHYDEIGLLKPSITKNNGYRYYSVDQIYTYDIIYLLKNCECSLKEIKETLNNTDMDTFFKFVDEKKSTLLQQRERIDKAIQLLEQSSTITKTALQGDVNIPYITERDDDTYIITTACNASQSLNNQEIATTLNHHFTMCDSLSTVDRFPLGHIILEQTYNCGELHHAYIYSGIRTPLKEDNEFYSRQQVISKGTYLNIKHKGTYETIGKAYQELLLYIYSHHLSIASDIYEESLLSHFATSSEEEHIIHIFVKVS